MPLARFDPTISDGKRKQNYALDGAATGTGMKDIQWGLVLRRGYLREYLVVNRIVVKRVLFKWFKWRWVHGPNRLVK